MMPEIADYLDKAQQCLGAARTIAGVFLPAVAAREAYLAAFHAAEAYIFAHTGRAVKTHRGLRITFARLAKIEPRIDPKYVSFIADAYEFKSIADYAVGATARAITAEDAKLTIETAARFLDTITDLLSTGPGPGS